MSKKHDGYEFRPSRFAWRNGDPVCPPVHIGDGSVKPRARLIDQAGAVEILTIREPRYRRESADVNRAAVVSNHVPMKGEIDYDRGHDKDDERCWKTRTRGAARTGRQWQLREDGTRKRRMRDRPAMQM